MLVTALKFQASTPITRVPVVNIGIRDVPEQSDTIVGRAASRTQLWPGSTPRHLDNHARVTSVRRYHRP
jgi:hypothetical protein